MKTRKLKTMFLGISLLASTTTLAGEESKSVGVLKPAAAVAAGVATDGLLRGSVLIQHPTPWTSPYLRSLIKNDPMHRANQIKLLKNRAQHFGGKIASRLSAAVEVSHHVKPDLTASYTVAKIRPALRALVALGVVYDTYTILSAGSEAYGVHNARKVADRAEKQAHEMQLRLMEKRVAARDAQ